MCDSPQVCWCIYGVKELLPVIISSPILFKKETPHLISDGVFARSYVNYAYIFISRLTCFQNAFIDRFCCVFGIIGIINYCTYRAVVQQEALGELNKFDNIRNRTRDLVIFISPPIFTTFLFELHFNIFLIFLSSSKWMLF